MFRKIARARVRKQMNEKRKIGPPHEDEPKTEETLKACPFCGGRARISSDGGVRKFIVYCNTCGVGTREDDYKERAIDYWNRRPSDTSGDEREKNLLEVNHRMGDELLKADESLIRAKELLRAALYYCVPKDEIREPHTREDIERFLKEGV